MVQVTRNQPFPTYRSQEMYQTFTLAMELFNLNLVQLAGKTLKKLFIQLEGVLEEASFNLLWNILDIVYEMKMNGQSRLLTIFIQHLQALTQVKLATGHPVYTFIRQISIQDSNQLDAIRACHSAMLDELQSQLTPVEYRQQLHNSCVVRMKRTTCVVPDPFTVGIWMLKKRNDTMGAYFASCWSKIVSRRSSKTTPPLPRERSEVQVLAENLVQRRLDTANLTFAGAIIADATRRLAVIEMGAGGVLYDGHTEGDTTKAASEATEAGHFSLELIDWHAMLAIERNLRLVGLCQDADLIKGHVQLKVEQFVRDI